MTPAASFMGHVSMYKMQTISPHCHHFPNSVGLAYMAIPVPSLRGCSELRQQLSWQNAKLSTADPGPRVPSCPFASPGHLLETCQFGRSPGSTSRPVLARSWIQQLEGYMSREEKAKLKAEAEEKDFQMVRRYEDSSGRTRV